MGSLTNEETQVSYHRDHMESPKPAINVKVHGFDRVTYALIESAMGEKFATQAFESAEFGVYSQFWDADMPILAKMHGFDVQGAGRSGGWIEILNRDPMDLEGDERKRFLQDYREFAEWCRNEVREAPSRIGRAAQDYAIETLLGRTVTARSIAAFETDFREGIIKLAESLGYQRAA